MVFLSTNSEVMSTQNRMANALSNQNRIFSNFQQEEVLVHRILAPDIKKERYAYLFLTTLILLDMVYASEGFAPTISGLWCYLSRGVAAS